MLNVLLNFFNKVSKKSIKNPIKKLIIFVQVLALALAPLHYSLAAAPTSTESQSLLKTAQQQLFLSTLPIETSAGATRAEVQSFEINNEQDLGRVRAEILEKTKNDSKANEFFTLDVSTAEHQTTALDQVTKNVTNEIENAISYSNKIEIKPVVVGPVEKSSFFKKHYNTTLALVRFFGNSTVITTGLIMGRGIPAEHALLVGVLAGAMSAGLQLKNKELFNWLSNSVILVKTAKKMGLLPKNDGAYIGTAERTLKEAETYGRWASIETGFLLVCQTAMSLLNIPVAENLLLTVAKATLSQGIFDVGVLKTSNELEKINPNWSSKVVIFKNVSTFSGSAISALAAIGAMVGIPYANLFFITLTTAGLVLNFAPRLIKLKPMETILSKWRPRGAAISCRKLIESL
ncbi:MAG: hypothetical protein AABY53_10750 [Bdellovibrionota bacterium]